MPLCRLDINNQTLIILITSIVWAINFRSSFKNINLHMDTGSFYSLKFDPLLILIKNIICCFYFIAFFIEKKMFKFDNNKRRMEKEKEKIKEYEVENNNNKKLYYNNDENSSNEENLAEVETLALYNNLETKGSKICFILKVEISIIFIYISEELYFIMINIHILDRIICSIRNFFILFTMLIFSPILYKEKINKSNIKNFFNFKRHQIIPLIIIFLLSFSMWMYNIFGIPRFLTIYNINILYYIICFILTGIEMTLIKYLVDKLFINKFLILGIKGLLGTGVFIFIYIKIGENKFYNFFDNLLSFEYLMKPEPFEIYYKIFYVLSFCILDYLKIIVINKSSQMHLLSSMMITDIIYFPLYCLERFGILKLSVSVSGSFALNSIVGAINMLSMLIFNEILELNCCGLNKHIRKNIIEREEKEINQILQLDNYDDGSSEQ